MNENNYQAQWDADYVKEIYWESKGLGYNADPVAPRVLPISPKSPCSKCGRMGTKGQLHLHNKLYPDCDK